ncbi:MAG: dUTP diphosphatase [Gammaproteobacteria bacterium]|nr:MAG: dUTP diphosphatase [Gammaproteobacteria bacterium]
MLFRKLRPDARLPHRSHENDTGADLYFCPEDGLPVTLAPGETRVLGTGLELAFAPDHYDIQIRPRSGLAAKHGLTVLNTPGTVDPGYRGEIKVILSNFSNEPFTVEPGTRIAQLVVNFVYRPPFSFTEEENETTRGEGGFGSTGL